MKFQAKHLAGALVGLVSIAACGGIMGVGALDDLALSPPVTHSTPAGAWRFPDEQEVLNRAAARPGEEPGAVHVAVVRAARSPEQVFAAAGCVACHNPASGPFYKNLVAARQASTAAQLAAWIKNPQRYKPTTQMPNLSSVVTPEEADALGAWIKAGNPVGPVPKDLPAPVPMPNIN